MLVHQPEIAVYRPHQIFRIETIRIGWRHGNAVALQNRFVAGIVRQTSGNSRASGQLQRNLLKDVDRGTFGANLDEPWSPALERESPSVRRIKRVRTAISNHPIY